MLDVRVQKILGDSFHHTMRDKTSVKVYRQVLNVMMSVHSVVK